MKYVNGYLNYTGSKYKLLEQILPEMDYSKKYFADIFAGSMVVSANIIHKYEKILVNDIIEDIIKIHKAVLKDDEIINNVKKLSKVKHDKEAFLKLRLSYNENKTPEKLWALILSCNNNFMRFNKSGKFNSSWGKREFNENTQKKVNDWVKLIRPYKDKFIFHSQKFNKIKIINPTMVYLDPPYGYCVENGKITNYQISEAGYNTTYNKEDDIKLYDYCKELDKNGSSFMLSGLLEHDDKKSWLLNKLINDGYKYKLLNFDYNSVSKKGEKISKEAIIMNY